MKHHIITRVLDIAHYMLQHNSTVRDAATQFGVSKTTVHKDMRLRLPTIDPHLARSVDTLLNINLAERHLRGGEATRAKYEQRGLTNEP